MVRFVEASLFLSTAAPVTPIIAQTKKPATLVLTDVTVSASGFQLQYVGVGLMKANQLVLQSTILPLQSSQLLTDALGSLCNIPHQRLKTTELLFTYRTDSTDSRTI